MRFNYLITGLLAVIFCITGHYFMTAYTNYSISQSRLGLLRSQERSVKRQIVAYQNKITQLKQVSDFVNHTQHLGLKKERWDTFFVDLTNEPISFDKLSNLLKQTQNTDHYLFKPHTLSIKTGPPDSDQIIKTSPDSSDPKHPDPEKKPLARPEKMQYPHVDTDVTVSLNGRFLIKRKGTE